MTPARIGGFPTCVRELDLGGARFRMVDIEGVEAHLDRDRLLTDEGYEPPYWALVWTGACLLADRLSRQTDLSGLQVLDAGCGLGVVALGAAAAGARVTAVDRDPVAMEFVAASARLNGFDMDLRCTDLREVARSRAGEFDIVTAAELLYEVAVFRELADALGGLLRPGGLLWSADARRVDTREFHAALVELGWRETGAEVVRVREESTLVEVRLSRYAQGTGVADAGRSDPEARQK